MTLTISPWEFAARQFEPQRRRWATPGELARALDPKTVQTPMLNLIDAELVRLADTRDGRLIISCPPQEGKLVADDTPVPTPDGWVRHGDLRPGSIVFHPSGRQIKVVEVHPPAEAYLRVHFSDHTSILVHPAHEWTVWDRARGRLVTLETRQLAAVKLSHGTPGRRGHKYRFHLPLREALDCPDAELPVDPYTLGVWLGDGSTTKAAVTHHPADTYELPYPVTARCTHATTGIVTTYYGGGLRQRLHEAGVIGNKHIPGPYLRASIRQRRALLAGLIDTDGHVSASGQVSFDNTNEALVRSVAELIRSLGYRAHVHRPTPPTLSSSGIQGKREMWRVTFTPHDQCPARLPRKAVARLGRRERIAITAITEEAPQVGRCITVDAEDGLYLVGEGMLPTHNSQRVSRRFPLWMLTQNPDTRIAIASYEHGVARRWGRAIRDDITANAATLGLAVRDDLSAQHEWQLAGHEGGVYAVGIGGALTGRPVDLMVIDDPIKDRVQADSATYRERVWDWWTDVAATRLAPGAPVVLILTRWHDDDLAGRLLAAEDGHLWRVLNIPAQADHDPNKGETDPLGREPGEYLLSARGRTREQWEAIKIRSGSRTWASLYQGRPAPAEGDLFQRSWWRWYTQPRWVVRDDGSYWAVGADEVIQSWDMAFKATSDSDYVCGQVWGRWGLQVYLLDEVHARLSFVETRKAVRQLAAKWPQATLKLVEDKANGTAVINSLAQTVAGLVPEEPQGSKYARAAAVAPFVEAGQVWLPAPELAPWVGDFIEECAAFPNGSHDDQVDAMSQALNRLLLAPLLVGDHIITYEDLDDGLDSYEISPY